MLLPLIRFLGERESAAIIMWQHLQKMMCTNILCGHLFNNCLLLLLTFPCLFLNVIEAQDTADATQPSMSTGTVIVVLSIMFSITFLLLAYVKFCRVSPFQIVNPDIHRQNLGRFSGIDKQVIEALPVFKFSSLRGSRQGLECVVCLSIFQDTETLRLLPKCKHAFHVSCIDKWLESHSTCPLCRSRVDPGDIDTFASSISSSFLRVPSNLTDDPSLEIFVHRHPSRQASSRFNSNKEGKNWDEALALHKFNHKIVISGFVGRSRWSDLNSTDLLSLNSEMLSVMSSSRFFTSDSTNLPSTSSKQDQNSLTLLTHGEKRSVSEIANVPRFAGIKKLVVSGDSEERLWRMWLPIARRTVQRFAPRGTSSREFDHKHLVSIV